MFCRALTGFAFSRRSSPFARPRRADHKPPHSIFPNPISRLHRLASGSLLFAYDTLADMDLSGLSEFAATTTDAVSTCAPFRRPNSLFRKKGSGKLLCDHPNRPIDSQDYSEFQAVARVCPTRRQTSANTTIEAH
jgi:hypothetical protein